MRDEYGINLYMTWDYYDRLMESVCSNLGMGGRGVVNMLEINFLNPLSKTVFCGDFGFGTNLMIRGWYSGEDPRLTGTFDCEDRIPTAAEGFELIDEQARKEIQIG